MLPNIPEMHNIPCIPISSSLSLILVSIALEEIGLSHIINAEGEKIQEVIKSFGCEKASVCDMLAVNKSVSDTLRNVLKKEILLELKMVEVLEALPKFEPHGEHCKRE